MSDIVERLRDYRGGDVSVWNIMEEAADEITRLHGVMTAMDPVLNIWSETIREQGAEIKQLRAALEELVGAVADHTSQKSIPLALRSARAALSGDKQ